MTPLQKTLNVGGFTLEQLQRSGDVAIYAQKKRGFIESYEVIRVQKHSAGNVMGKHYEDREGYPRNEAWGRDAFTCLTLERARERFNAMVGTR